MESQTYTLRKQWNDTCLAFSQLMKERGMEGEMKALSSDTSARIMAVLYCHGNNEAFTLSGHFNADREWIQQRFHLQGGEIPDEEFSHLLKKYVKELEDYEREFKAEDKTYHGYGDPKPEWCVKLFKDMYGFQV